MSCLDCGAALAADDAFCPRCGARQGKGGRGHDDPARSALERVLGMQYEMVRLLGRGGMGAVYLARERALERAVAIKILPPEFASDAESRERFRREARTAAKLTHPNIVPLHTFGDIDGMLYLVMGYVRGESLAQRLHREGRVEAGDTRRILAEMADALHYAHRQGVVHRDIKPDNILLEDETGRPLLTDFGIAKATVSGATLTEAGAVVGTPHYMSPEQASGERTLDGRSDLYSLGVVGYQMLSGRLPFDGDSLRDVVVQHVTKEPTPLAAVAPQAPPDLLETVTRCLAKDPARRWPSGKALQDALNVGEVEDTDLLPHELRVLRGAGFWNLVAMPSFLGLMGALYAAGVLSPGLQKVLSSTLRAVPLILLVSGPSLYFNWRRALRKGHSRERVRQLIAGPPSWWASWWPARYRAPNDVWPRLPRFVRRARGARLGFWCLVYAIALTIIALLGATPIGVPGIVKGLLALLAFELITAPTVLITTVFLAEWWGKCHGLSAQESAALLSRPTSDVAFWRKPRFAALLEPARPRQPGPAEPQSPEDFVVAIGEAARQFGEPLRGVGREAVAAARQLAAAMAAIDREIGQLARDASPAELSGIDRKLAVLGEPAGDNDARRQMRALLESQRDLMRTLVAQLEAASARRVHLADMLRALWLQTATLRAQAAADGAWETDVSGRIRVLCDEISAQAEALATVRGIARPS